MLEVSDGLAHRLAKPSSGAKMLPMRQLARSTSTQRALPALAFTAAALLAAAPAAQGAATVSRSGAGFTLTSDAAADVITMRPERANDPFVRFVAVPAASLTAGPGCRESFSRILRRDTVTCGRIQTKNRGTTPALTAQLGAGDDVFKALGSDQYPRLIADGGEGDDEIIGTVMADDISGGPGDDELHGQSDVDNLRGDAGDDVIFGDGDADHVVGGPGRDELLGDGRDGDGSYATNGSGGDTIDATDFPTDLTGLSAEQILAIAPEPDAVACGPGLADIVTAEPVDTVSPTCEVTLAPGAVRTPTLPVFPFAQTLTTHPGQRLAKLLQGEPFRFAVSASVGGLSSATLTVSRADARRLGLGTSENARTIANSRPVLIGSSAPSELYLRVLWTKRAALRTARSVQVTLTVTTNHADASGGAAVDSESTTTLRLVR